MAKSVQANSGVVQYELGLQFEAKPAPSPVAKVSNTQAVSLLSALLTSGLNPGTHQGTTHYARFAPDLEVLGYSPGTPTMRAKQIAEHPDIVHLATLADEIFCLPPGKTTEVVERRNSKNAEMVIQAGVTDVAARARERLVECLDNDSAAALQKSSEQMGMITNFMRYAPVLLLMTSSPEEVAKFRSNSLNHLPAQMEQVGKELHIAQVVANRRAVFNSEPEYTGIAAKLGKISNFAEFSAEAIRTFSRVFSLIYTSADPENQPKENDVRKIVASFSKVLNSFKSTTHGDKPADGRDILSQVTSICNYCEQVGIKGKALIAFFTFVDQTQLQDVVAHLPTDIFKHQGKHWEVVIKGLGNLIQRSEEFNQLGNPIAKYLHLKQFLEEKLKGLDSDQVILTLYDREVKISTKSFA